MGLKFGAIGSHAKKLDTQLNGMMRIISGIVEFTTVQNGCRVQANIERIRSKEALVKTIGKSEDAASNTLTLLVILC